METIDELTRKCISFYPAIGRADYNRFASLSEAEKKLKVNKPKMRRISTQTLSLAEVADYISSPMTKTGYNSRGGFHSDNALPAITYEVRNSEDYSDIKLFLFDHVVFGGVPIVREEERTDKRTGETFKVRTQRKASNFTGEAIFSGFIIVDIDHLSEANIDIRELRESLSAMPETGLRLLFVSPSGDGLKLVCKSKRGYNSSETYKREYEALQNYLNTTLKNIYPSFKVDTSGADICRTCFLPHDDEVRLFNGREEFDSEKYPAPKKEAPKERKYTQYEGDDDGIEELVRRVEKSGIDIAPEYEEYFKLVSSFSSLGPRGLGYLHRVCSACPKYDPDDTEEDFKLVEDPKKWNIGYFVKLCKAHNINVNDYKNIRGGLSYEEYMSQNRPMKEKDIQTTASTEKGSPEAQNTLKYADRYILPQRGELWSELAKEPEGIETKYIFKGEDGEEPLFIPTEGVTMIGGLSSHCKSTFLRNLALQIAENGREGDTLFFSYEESMRKTKSRLLNTYIGEELNRGNRNMDCIRDFAKTGDLQYISETKRETFKKRSAEFEELLLSGKLRLYAVNDTSKDLIDFLREYNSQRGIKAVFVDYIQRLSSGRKEGDRKDELRHVSEDLQNFTTETQIPFVVAVQLNRATPSPLKMGANNLAESADLTRYAETIVCLWNSAKDEDITDDKFYSSNEYKALQVRGFTSGVSGTIYAKISKNKEGESGIDAVLKFNGKTGRIDPEGFEGLPDAKAPMKTTKGKIVVEEIDIDDE